MRDYDPHAPLIFIHVPKCAGTAVREIAQDWFPRRVKLHVFDEIEGTMPKQFPLYEPRFVPTFLKKPNVIYGHFDKCRGYGVKDYYPEVSQFVTILRDPFDTVVSRYFYVRKASKDWKNIPITAKRTLEEHLQNAKPNALNYFPTEMTLANYKDIIEEMFIEIGIVEELSYSLERIAEKLGKKFDRPSLKKVNTSQRDQQIPAQYREQFIEAFPLEYAVYDYAKSRLMAS